MLDFIKRDCLYVKFVEEGDDPEQRRNQRVPGWRVDVLARA